MCYVSPKCFARNLRETVRGVTPSRPRDDGTIRWVEDRDRNEGDAEKEERSKPGKLNAKYTFMGSLAVFGNRFEEGREKEFLDFS